MAIHDLARKETPHGTVTAVWFDSDEDNFVVQHEFVHRSFQQTGIHSLPRVPQRIINDVRVLSSGNPRRIARHYVNKAIGRYVVRGMYLR
jgi:hypothetical protein